MSGDAVERPLLLAWILIALSFLVPLLPLIPLLGYLGTVVAASARGDGVVPPIPGARSLLFDGVRATAVVLAFLLIPVAALLVTVIAALEGSPSRTDEFVGGLFVYGASTAALVGFLAGAYLCPVALARLGTDDSLRAAFDGSALAEAGGHAAYFLGWVVGFVAFVALGLVATALVSVPRLGPLLAALVLAYGSVLACHVWGRSLARV